MRKTALAATEKYVKVARTNEIANKQKQACITGHKRDTKQQFDPSRPAENVADDHFDT